ncbi:C-type lectin domain family 2 member D [Chelonia mydas]|uniref:C-type lectin domain family 2 member D n=1 Tax=Chelonia mydas TaxID=8469 RepID=M7BXF9_CHEMY|nr:C-type lectin domain family 2 member D [Chelonia mydas]
MSPVLESAILSETEKMWNGLYPAEKIKPNPLLASHVTQMKSNGTTHVTIPPKDGENSKIYPAGLRSRLKSQARRWAVLNMVLILILTITVITLIVALIALSGLRSRLKSQARRWAVLNMVLILILTITVITLIVALIALSARKSEQCPAGPACPDGWLGYLGKCYYFSETEGNWTYSQSHCSAFGASLAVIDTQQEMDFMMRYKNIPNYWIGLRRDLNQPWKWVSGTEFSNWFIIAGGGSCAFLNSGDISSSGCSREGRWICSKPVEKTEGRAQ